MGTHRPNSGANLTTRSVALASRSRGGRVTYTPVMLRTLFVLVVTLLAALRGTPLLAQSQAANGSIEGIIRDTSGGVLPGVTVALMHLDSGVERSSTTGVDGRYRALLLPLGSFRIVAELPGFKRFEQVGVRLGAGQTVVVNVTLDVGPLSETVTVNAEDRPVLDAAKIDAGRNLSAVEVKNLPLVSRNPYNANRDSRFVFCPYDGWIRRKGLRCRRNNAITIHQEV